MFDFDRRHFYYKKIANLISVIENVIVQPFIDFRGTFKPKEFCKYNMFSTFGS